MGQHVSGRLSLCVAGLGGGQEAPWTNGAETCGISHVAGHGSQLRPGDGLVPQLPVGSKGIECLGLEVRVVDRIGKRVELGNRRGVARGQDQFVGRRNLVRVGQLTGV